MSTPQDNEFNFVSLIVTVVKYLRKNSTPILIITTLGIIFSVSLGLTKADIIESKMIIYSDILTKSYGEQIGKNLNNLIHQTDNSAAFKSLNIPLAEAKQILSIEVEIIPEKSPKEEDVERSTLIVTAELRHREILPKLQDAILRYFRDNQFLKIRVEHRQEYMRKMIVKLKSEIQSLDSIKRLLVFSNQSASRQDLAFIDPSNINHSIIELYRDQMRFQTGLDVVDSIQLVEGFSTISKPPRLKTSMLVLIGFAAGFALSLTWLSLVWLIKHTKPS